MTRQGFPTARLCVRPARVAVVLPASDGWIYDARLVLGTVSRVWGGAGHVVVSSRNDTVHQVLLDLLRAYDPDYLAQVPLTFADWRAKDRDAYQSWLATQQFVTAASDPETARQQLSRYIADDPIEDESAPAELMRRLLRACSPHRWHGADLPFPQYLHPRQTARGPLTDVQAIVSLWPPEEPLWTLDLSELDPALALMIETRIGSYNNTDGLGEVRRLPVMAEDFDALLSIAVAGDTGHARWDLRNRFQQAVGAPVLGFPEDRDEVRRILGWTPFRRSLTGLAELTTVDLIPQAVLVVGDSLDDYALALAYDRLSWRGTWLPQAMTDPAHEHFARVRKAIMMLRRDQVINQLNPSRLFITSSTLDPDLLNQIAERLTNGDPNHTSRRIAEIQIAAPSDVSLRGRKLIADPERYATSIAVPTATDDAGSVEFLTPVDLPPPSTIDASVISDLRWEVDIDLPGHQLPPRTALSGAVLAANEGAFAVEVRVGTGGVTAHSHSQGLILAGSPLSLRLARPRLQLPGPEGIFRVLAGAANVTVQTSDAGRRAATALALWPNLTAMAADLRGSVRLLLDAFTPPDDVKDAVYEVGSQEAGIAVRHQGYLTFAHAIRALGDAATTRATLDRLITSRVLRRGLLLRCERCNWLAFYSIETLAQVLPCTRCAHANELVQRNWRLPPDEPAWFYDLDQLVRDLLGKHGDVPLLASELISRSRRSALIEHELQLTRVGENRSFAEADICLIADGRIVVGEAKSTDSIDRPQIAKLVKAAATLTADEVHIATTKPAWKTATIDNLRRALAREYQPLGLRPPDIHVHTQLHDPTPADNRSTP